MTTYTAISNSDIDQDSPVTQPLMTLLRDNPLSISEGDPTAPKNKPLSLDTFVSLETIPTTGTTYTITGLELVDMYHFEGIINANSNSSGGESFKISLSDNGGSSWAAETTVATASFTGAGENFVCIGPHYIGLRTGLFVEAGNSANGATAIALPAGTVDAVRYRLTDGNSAYTSINYKALVLAPGVSS